MTHFRTLASIIEEYGGIIQTGPFGSQLHEHDYVQDGIGVVMPKDIKNGRIAPSSVAKITEEKAASLSRHKLKKGEIVFPRRGDIGKCAFVTANDEGNLCGTGCIKISVSENVLLSKFLFYYLGLRHVVEWLERNAVGTTMLNLNTSIIGGVQVPMISVREQRSILSVLESYDDLIENNRRRIELLEQSARLLYKEWFVHFRFPGHEHVKIVEGVPEGWTNLCIGEASEFLNRGITPKYDDEADGLVINQKCIRNGSLDVSLARRQSKEFNRDKQIKFGDVLINSTGEGTLGRVAQVLHEIDNCTVDSHVTIVRPTEIVPKFYFGLYLFSQESMLTTMGRGTTNQTELSKGDVTSLPIIIPSKFVASEFELIVEKIFWQKSNFMQQNRLLSQARDLLLPRLMNGEIAI